MLNYLGKHPLKGCAFEADRGRFDGKCLRAERLDFKPIALELIGDLGKDDHLPRFKFDQKRHKEALALNVFDLASAEDLLKKHTFVCDVLVDDPEAFFVDGEDERVAELAEW